MDLKKFNTLYKIKKKKKKKRSTCNSNNICRINDKYTVYYNTVKYKFHLPFIKRKVFFITK